MEFSWIYFASDRPTTNLVFQFSNLTFVQNMLFTFEPNLKELMDMQSYSLYTRFMHEVVYVGHAPRPKLGWLSPHIRTPQILDYLATFKDHKENSPNLSNRAYPDDFYTLNSEPTTMFKLNSWLSLKQHKLQTAREFYAQEWGFYFDAVVVLVFILVGSVVLHLLPSASASSGFNSKHSSEVKNNKQPAQNLLLQNSQRTTRFSKIKNSIKNLFKIN